MEEHVVPPQQMQFHEITRLPSRLYQMEHIVLVRSKSLMLYQIKVIYYQ